MTRFRAGALGALLLLVSLLAANAPAAFADEGSATWYGQPYHGRRMANGQVFDMYDPTTTACNLYPMGTWLRVTNPANGRSVTVQVRDRGGFSHALDLSYGAFMAIAEPGKMRINVHYEVVSGPDGEPLAAPAPQPEPVPEEAAPAPAPEPVADSGGAVHTVQPGETLGDLAATYGVSVEDLVAWNGLENPDLLVPGQVLVVTAGGAPASDSAAASVYVVQEGDVLWRIADDHGLTTGALIEANALDPAEPLYPGQELQIPGGAASTEDASAGAQWYTVQEGDTLVSIALQFGISTDTLLEINDVSDPDLVVPGQVLQVG